MKDKLIVIRRPSTHHKGPKTTASWPYGQPVPAGILIGKGSIITVEDVSIFESMREKLNNSD